MLDCPGGTFLGAGVKTVVLFFDKGAPTRKVWFYELDPGRNHLVSAQAKKSRVGPKFHIFIDETGAKRVT